MISLEEQRRVIRRLIEIFYAADPETRRGIVCRLNDLVVELRQQTNGAFAVPRYVLTGGEVWDNAEQQFVKIEDIDPETILPSEY